MFTTLLAPTFALLALAVCNPHGASARAIHPKDLHAKGYHKNTNDPVKRQAPAQACGDSDGNPVDVAALVSHAVAAGVPSAETDGKIFMTVSVVNTDGCGPYSCYVSKDATGQFFDTMSILTQVPDAAGTCGRIVGSTDYSLVTQLPENLECTGPEGSCLILCKNNRIPTGTCAAVKPGIAGRSTPPSSSHPAPAPPASISSTSFSTTPSSTLSSSSPSVQSEAPQTTIILTSVVDSTRTSLLTSTRFATSLTIARSSPSTSSSSSSTGVEAKHNGVPTIVAFSGENGPGSLAEQQYGGSAALLNMGGSGGGMGVPVGGTVFGGQTSSAGLRLPKGRASAVVTVALVIAAILKV